MEMSTHRMLPVAQQKTGSLPIYSTVTLMAPRQGLLTSFGIDSRNGLNEERCIGLRVLHKDEQELQGCLHHQAELEKR